MAHRRFSYELLERLVLDNYRSWDHFFKEVYRSTGVSMTDGARYAWEKGSCPSINAVEAMVFTLGVERDAVTDCVPA